MHARCDTQGAVLADDGGMMPGSAMDDAVAAKLWEVSATAAVAASASDDKPA